MRQLFSLMVPGGNTQTVPLSALEALQAIVAGLGAETYPLFLRLGGSLRSRMQPVTSSALLAEVEQFTPRMAGVAIPCLLFRDEHGQELGGLYASSSREAAAPGASAISLTPTGGGIRMIIRQVPPPAGFRSHPTLPSGYYECYFRKVMHSARGYQGIRTEAMGGSESPVSLPDLALPPVTRWDFARTAGKPSVALVECVQVPVHEAYKDVLHGLESACNESLRLKAPLQTRKE